MFLQQEYRSNSIFFKFPNNIRFLEAHFVFTLFLIYHSCRIYQHHFRCKYLLTRLFLSLWRSSCWHFYTYYLPQTYTIDVPDLVYPCRSEGGQRSSSMLKTASKCKRKTRLNFGIYYSLKDFCKQQISFHFLELEPQLDFRFYRFSIFHTIIPMHPFIGS